MVVCHLSPDLPRFSPKTHMAPTCGTFSGDFEQKGVSHCWDQGIGRYTMKPSPFYDDTWTVTLSCHWLSCLLSSRIPTLLCHPSPPDWRQCPVCHCSYVAFSFLSHAVTTPVTTLVTTLHYSRHPTVPLGLFCHRVVTSMPTSLPAPSPLHTSYLRCPSRDYVYCPLTSFSLRQPSNRRKKDGGRENEKKGRKKKTMKCWTADGEKKT